MKRRWKVVIVLAVVGLAAFLVWAFRSPSTPPLSIRFAGYVTNSALRLDETLPPKDGSVLAVFAVTNHTTRTMAVVALSEFRFQNVTETSLGQWLNVTNYDPYLGSNYPQLKSGEGALVGARVFATDKPIDMSVADMTYLGRNTWWGRIRHLLPLNRQPSHATATSEPR